MRKSRMKKGLANKKIVIYQVKSGALELRGDQKNETLWATQAQIADVFEVDRTVATKHIGNILKSKEVKSESNVQKMHIANSDKQTSCYSLDIILAVGYRVNSAKAIRFRQWATHVLRKHLIDGYTINRSRVAKNYGKFIEAVESVKKLLAPGSSVKIEDALELVKMFSGTWLSLEAYDKSSLPTTGASKKQVRITAEELLGALSELKRELVGKKGASSLFGSERDRGSVAGIVGNVFQSFDGKDLYATLEEKAAHLLYFMVKNHPFTDGNKRNGAFAFVWLLGRAGALDKNRLTPEALTVLTLLVAESDPKDKTRITGLILLLLKR